jgi:hypothetical protein
MLAICSCRIWSSSALPGGLLMGPDEADLPWFPDPLLLDDLEDSTPDIAAAEQTYASLLGIIVLLRSLFCIVHCFAS